MPMLRYGVTKFNDLETREQLVALLENIDTWYAVQSKADEHSEG